MKKSLRPAILFFIIVTSFSCRDQFLTEMENNIYITAGLSAVPEVSGPKATADTTPEWTWNQPVGAVNFRYKLDIKTDVWRETEGSHIRSFSPNDPLEDGTYTLYVQGGGSSGEWSDSGSKSIIVNSNAPDIEAGNDISWTCRSTQLNVSLIMDENRSYTYLWKTIPENSGVNFSSTNVLNPTISGEPGIEKVYTLEITCTDDLGNFATDTVLFHWDNILPELGGNGLNILNKSMSSIQIGCEDASDGPLNTYGIQYRPVLSLSDNVNTVNSALVNDILNMEWGNDSSMSVDSLSTDTNYYINILVKDSAGNISAHGSVEHKILNQSELFLSDGSASDYAGSQISISDDGSSFVTAALNIRDQVYAFKWNSSIWTEYILSPSSPGSNYTFGGTVAISGDGNRVAVRYRDNDTAEYNIYLFTWNGSSWLESILLSGNQSGSFAESFSMSYNGERIAVTNSTYSSGTISVFSWNGSSWNQTDISNSASYNSSGYGYKASISGDGESILTSAMYYDGVSEDAGYAFIYEWNGSSWIESLIPPEADTDGMQFGISHDISKNGEVLAISSYHKSGSSEGEVTILSKNGSLWERATITASDGLSQYQFGLKMDLSSDGSVLTVGASNYQYEGVSYGAAYQYRHSSDDKWNETMYMAFDKYYGNDFGAAVAVSDSGNVFLVGSIGDNDNGVDAGSIYVYK